MKDRIERTKTKKVSHRLTSAFIITTSICLVGSALLFTSISLLSQENKNISERIQTYTDEINLLDNDDNSALQSHK